LNHRLQRCNMKCNDYRTGSRTRAKKARARAIARSKRARTRARARAKRARAAPEPSQKPTLSTELGRLREWSADDVEKWFRAKGLSDYVLLQLKEIDNLGIGVMRAGDFKNVKGLGSAVVKLFCRQFNSLPEPEPEPLDANDDVDDPKVFCYCGCRHEA
jgi:hypothetical protein